MKSTLKLRPLIEGYGQISQKKKIWPLEEKKEALEMIGKYNEYGDHLRRKHNLMEIAETLSKVAEAAKRFTENLSEGTFESKTVSRNMQMLEKCSNEFAQLANEGHIVEQRMEALYEDMGHVLGRYFEIKDIQSECEDGRTKTVVSVEPFEIGEKRK